MATRVFNRPAVALLFAAAIAAFALAGGTAAAWAQSGPPPMRHHITLAGGYAQYTSDDVTGGGEVFDNAGFGDLSYRYSFTPKLDLVFDARGVIASESGMIDTGSGIYNFDMDVTSSFFGPGVRYHFTEGRVRPYVQGTVLLVEEEVSVDLLGATASDSWTGVGAGVAGGVDLRLGKLVSIPVEAQYLFGDPEDDVSNWGFGLGVTFNFGPMP